MATELETWDTSKKDKYEIDLESYDHTIISSRPAILMNLYTSNRIPYIKVIHLWDHLCDGLLSSKHNTLTIGRGEPGMTTPSPSSSMSSSASNTVGEKEENWKILQEILQTA